MIVALLAALQLATMPVPAPSSPEAAKLDAIARSFVTLSLEVENYDPGFVDAYYGPAEWKPAKQPLQNLATEASALLDPIGQVTGGDLARAFAPAARAQIAGRPSSACIAAARVAGRAGRQAIQRTAMSCRSCSGLSVASLSPDRSVTAGALPL